MANFFNPPVCLHPRVILDRTALDYVFRGDLYRLSTPSGCEEHRWQGNSVSVFNRRINYILSPSKLCREPHNFGDPVYLDEINISDFRDCYVVSPDGEMRYLYKLVPCGHCDACAYKKKFSFGQMCEFETLLHSFCPWFGTLTYDDAHLPPHGELMVRDVQLFLKRFRQNLKRMYNGMYDYPLRYAICGEYGKKNKRPHYHFIFWNLHACNHLQYEDVKDIITTSWAQGFVQARLIDPRKTDKSFQYTCKYVAKSSLDDFNNRRKPFIVSSRTKVLGGIGKPFLIEKFSNYLTKDIRTSFLYYNKFNASIGEVAMTSRVLDCLYPSFCRLIPSSIRRSVKAMEYFISRSGKWEDIEKMCSEVILEFQKYIYIPDYSHTIFDYPDKEFGCGSLDEAFFIYFNWRNHPDRRDLSLSDILSSAMAKDALRNKFLFYNFTDVVDSESQAMLYANYMQYSHSLEETYASVYG